MTNEEKKQFIADAHRLYMKYRPYDTGLSLGEMKLKEDAFWDVYHKTFSSLLPNKLYKYRKPTELAIEAFENDKAWFSHPADFDDTVDSVLNNDIENEMVELEKNPNEVIKKLASSFIKALATRLGYSVRDDQINNALPLFNNDGTFNEKDMRVYLLKVFPPSVADPCIRKLKMRTTKVINNKVLESVKGLLNNYMDLNKALSENVFTYSLAESGNNQAMWGLYADESRGFCIEYSFPDNIFEGQRVLLNLLPIYYGEKPSIKFIDTIIKGINSTNQINGISYDDYKEWFVSAYTKDSTYEFQKEWRITFHKSLGGNLQPLPFAKSIILGERMSEANKKRLIEIAKQKKIDVYIRSFNRTKSKIIITKL